MLGLLLLGALVGRQLSSVVETGASGHGLVRLRVPVLPALVWDSRQASVASTVHWQQAEVQEEDTLNDYF